MKKTIIQHKSLLPMVNGEGELYFYSDGDWGFNNEEAIYTIEISDFFKGVDMGGSDFNMQMNARIHKIESEINGGVI